jgi:hypothetical protein
LSGTDSPRHLRRYREDLARLPATAFRVSSNRSMPSNGPFFKSPRRNSKASPSPAFDVPHPGLVDRFIPYASKDVLPSTTSEDLHAYQRQDPPLAQQVEDEPLGALDPLDSDYRATPPDIRNGDYSHPTNPDLYFSVVYMGWSLKPGLRQRCKATLSYRSTTEPPPRPSDPACNFGENTLSETVEA